MFGNLKKNKHKNLDFNMKWEIVKKVKPLSPGEKVCKLYLQKKKNSSSLGLHHL